MHYCGVSRKAWLVETPLTVTVAAPQIWPLSLIEILGIFAHQVLNGGQVKTQLWPAGIPLMVTLEVSFRSRRPLTLSQRKPCVTPPAVSEVPTTVPNALIFRA